MVFIVQLRQRDHQQAVVFTGIAVNNRGAVICAGSVSTEDLSGQRLLKIGHEGLFKTQITHLFCIFSYPICTAFANKCKITVLY